MRPSSRGSPDELNECGACSHVLRGLTEADNSSVSDSVRPELGHNEFSCCRNMSTALIMYRIVNNAFPFRSIKSFYLLLTHVKFRFIEAI